MKNVIIFNVFKFVEFYSYHHQLVAKMNDYTLPIIDKTKLLGTIITDDLKWNANTEEIVKKANQRMLLLRKSTEFTNSIADLKIIYKSYVRSQLEQSSVLWGSSITEENKIDLERVQKNACRIILGSKYINYEDSLKLIGLDTLEERRKHISLNFAKNCIENKTTKKLFPLRNKLHKFKTRKEEIYKVKKPKLKRLQNSTVPFLRKILNEEHIKNCPKLS